MYLSLPSMSPTDIHIWRIFLDNSPTHPEILSPAERDRAARFRFERDRIHFHNAHTALRQILARYANLEPQALEFHLGAYGKPSLTNVPAVEFNLSHSNSYALVAVAASPVGIDIEHLRADFDVIALAQRFFAPAETAIVRAEPDRFFEFWTRKEAFIKAIGMGVLFPLQGFDTCTDRVNIYAPTDQTAWYAQTFHPVPNYIAAVVTPHSNSELKQFDWTNDA
jgi:4'-phosphopantetheinyl transferase